MGKNNFFQFRLQVTSKYACQKSVLPIQKKLCLKEFGKILNEDFFFTLVVS